MQDDPSRWKMVKKSLEDDHFGAIPWPTNKHFNKGTLPKSYSEPIENPMEDGENFVGRWSLWRHPLAKQQTFHQGDPTSEILEGRSI